MAMSGIEIDEGVNTVFDDIKIGHKHKWVTFKIENKKKVVVDEIGDRHDTDSKDVDKCSFDEMKAKLTKDPRYILYDFGFKMKDGRLIQKIAFIFWCDDNNAPIGMKMIYASTKDTVKKCFSGIGLEFQANDCCDMDYDCFCHEVERKS